MIEHYTSPHLSVHDPLNTPFAGVDSRSPIGIIKQEIPVEQYSEELIQKYVDVFVLFLADKGFDREALQIMEQLDIFAPLFLELVLRLNADEKKNDQLVTIIKTAVRKYILHGATTVTHHPPRYRGTPGQNSLINSGISTNPTKGTYRRTITKQGAVREFVLTNNFFDRLEQANIAEYLKDVKVVVIGGGAGGILTTRMLIELGIRRDNITVIDPRGDYGGIWRQENVQAARNNPFDISFLNIVLDAAPRDRTGSGKKITTFLQNIVHGSHFRSQLDLPPVTRGVVTKVKPGDCTHQVVVKRRGVEETIDADIVINSIGNSRPLPVQDEKSPIQFNIEKQENLGYRWQQVLTEEKAREYERDGVTLVFVGLGNSTGEMLVQLREFSKKGIHVQFVVLTHYSKECIDKPDTQFVVNGKIVQVNRELKTPNLTRYAGDLPVLRTAYDWAKDDKRVMMPTVKKITIKDNTLTIESDTEIFILPKFQMFTLVGYGQDPDVLRQFGLTVIDEQKGTIAVDFDGEGQKLLTAFGRERVHPGFFTIGTPLKSESDPNAPVIPGIQFRLHDLMFTLLTRSFEAYSMKRDTQ